MNDVYAFISCAFRPGTALEAPGKSSHAVAVVIIHNNQIWIKLIQNSVRQVEGESVIIARGN